MRLAFESVNSGKQTALPNMDGHHSGPIKGLNRTKRRNREFTSSLPAC